MAIRRYQLRRERLPRTEAPRGGSANITRRGFIMSMSAAMTLDPRIGPKIAKSELVRLEGFGDNCEFGFVLRRLGFEDGMLFRWASIRPESLLATLRGDFEDLYEFDNLVPQQAKMVRDLHYGTAWHTQMYSSRRDGTLTFEADIERRREIHAKEASKLAYLVAKLRRKFTHPNPVFVIKANSGIPEQVLEAIHYQIYRRATSPRFLLLEVRDDATRAGTVELLDRNRMRGYVSRLAPYERSDDTDDAGWIAVLAQALAHNAEAPDMAVSTLSVPIPQAVLLRFPEGSGPDLLTPVPGDVRAGIPSLIGGSAWCRMVNDETYRLHAAGLNADATALRWTGVQLPPNCILTVQAKCAISQSLPVCATLEIIGADGTILRNQHVFDGVEEEHFSIPGSLHLPNPLTVSLHAEPLRPLRMGERAVIDVDPIKAVPS
jgi:hypothetical protein